MLRKKKAELKARVAESFHNLPKYSDKQLEEIETIQNLLRVYEMLRQDILRNLENAQEGLEQSSDKRMSEIYSQKIEEVPRQLESLKESKRNLEQRMQEEYSEYLRHMALREDCFRQYNKLTDQYASSD